MTETSREITGQKRVEEELRLQSEIMANMSEGLYLIRLDDVVIVYANPKFEKMFGYAPGEMIGRHASIVNAPTDKSPEDRAEEILAVLYESGEWHGEVNNIKKDGTPFWCYANVSIFDHSEHGKVLVAVHIDITRRKQAEEALKESEKKYRHFFSTVKNGWVYHKIVTDAENRPVDYIFLEVNDAYEQLTGLVRGEIIGKRVTEVLPGTENDPADWIGRFGEVALNGTACSFENYSEAMARWYTVSATCPEPGYFIVVFDDITERKQAEEALREEMAFSRSLVDTAQTIVLVLDTEGRIVRSNPYMEEVSGYKLAEVKGKDWFDTFLPVADHSKIRTLFKESVGDIQIRSNVNPILTKAGHERQIEWYVKTLKDAHGNVVGVLAVGQDITERKRAEEVLKEREDMISLLLNSMTEGVLGLDAYGHIKFCNQSALNMLGYEEHGLIGQPLHDLIAHTNIDGSSVSKEECTSCRAIAGGKPAHNEDVILWRADGSWFSAEHRAIPLISKEQNTGAVFTFIDITDKKKLLEQRIRSSQLASLGELAAGMAHEINNPITRVINYAQILLNKHQGEGNSKEILEGIIKEGERVASIVHNLLGFAYKDRDKMAPLRVEDFVNESLQIVLQQLNRDGIHFDVETSDGLPKVFGNAQQLGQVMLNLIGNARHALNEKHPATHPDKILRICARQKVSNYEKRLQLTVWDQGCGIPEEHMDKIFNPFFTTKAARTGTGLGLSVSHDILLAHGATINVESAVGQYTKFVLEFPVIEENAQSR